MAIAVLGLAASAYGQGGFLGIRKGLALEAGSTLEVRWTGPCPDSSGATEAELILSLDGGLTFPIRLTPELAACAASFRWQIPNLPTSRARIALRAGSGEGSGDERLDLVSEEFTILADPDDDPEDLVQGSREWWTRQALTGVGAEELPADSMAGAREQLVAPDSCPEVSDPGSPTLDLPRVTSAHVPEGRARRRAVCALLPASNGTAAAPLRL